MKNRLNWLLPVLFVAFLCACSPYAKITQRDASTVRVDTIRNFPADSATEAIIMPYRQALEKEMKEILAYSEVAMEKSLPEGLLNNFVADLTLEMGRKLYKPADNQNIDICLLNNGGLRTALPKGAITREKVFELMPFENEMVVLTLSGAKTLDMINYIARKGGVPISGLKLGIKDEKAIDILINNKAFDEKRNYKIVTSDYLAQGGDKMSFFNDPVAYEKVGMKIRDAIISYMTEKNKAGQSLNAKKDGRIYYAQ